MKEAKIKIITVGKDKLDRVADIRQKSPEQVYQAIEVRYLIEEALRVLTDRERKILKLRFGLDYSNYGDEYTLEEIGRRFKLSSERIRQIEAIALRKLIHPSIRKGIFERIKPIQEQLEKEKKDADKIIEFPTDLNLIIVSSDVGEKMIRFFSEHPEEMKTMDRKLLDEMIAELFYGFGYEVELTKQTRDGGRDIIAIKDSEVSVKYLIEAKRPEPRKPIGVVPVRALYGVKCREKATKAILATTTYFTRDAKIEFKENIWELELREYKGIIDWINSYLKIKDG